MSDNICRGHTAANRNHAGKTGNHAGKNGNHTGKIRNLEKPGWRDSVEKKELAGCRPKEKIAN
jgi:hypothetical protein